MQRCFRVRLACVHCIEVKPAQGRLTFCPLVRPTVLPPGPVLSITGGPYNVTAGETAQLNGSANCSNPTCTYGWVVKCPPFSAVASQTATAAGISVNITTGPNNATSAPPIIYQINTVGLTTALVCNVSFSGTGASHLQREAGVWRPRAGIVHPQVQGL